MQKVGKYEILEPLGRDLAGTNYRARDPRTGDEILLRKLATFGSEIRELNDEEQVAYQVAIGRLAQIRHPSLPVLLDGGCDPSDGVPFMVCKWVEANPLTPIIKNEPLTNYQATSLLSSAMEVCDLVSHLFAEEGIWIEAQLDAISVLDSEYNDRFLFWVSPLKWLPGNETDRSIRAIIDLSEDVLQNSKDTSSDPSSGPIGTWIKWLKSTAGKQATIHEAREILAASAGIEPPAPREELVEKATRKRSWLDRLPRLPLAKFKRPKMPLFLMLCLLLVIEAIIGWVWVRKISATHEADIENINRRMSDFREDIMDMDDSNPDGNLPGKIIEPD